MVQTRFRLGSDMVLLGFVWFGLGLATVQVKF